MGDAITALGSFFGDAIWAVPSGDDAVDRVESHIALCTDDGREVLLELHRGAAKTAAAEQAEDPNLIENAAVRSTTDMYRESGHLLLFFSHASFWTGLERGVWEVEFRSNNGCKFALLFCAGFARKLFDRPYLPL